MLLVLVPMGLHLGGVDLPGDRAEDHGPWTYYVSPDGNDKHDGRSPARAWQTLRNVEAVVFHPGDRLLLFTDGLTEAMNARGEEFGMHRILQVMGHAEVEPSHNGAGLSDESVDAGALGGRGIDAGFLPPLSSVQNGAPQPASAGVSVNLPNDIPVRNGQRQSPCEPGPSSDEPEDLKSIERAVQNHVGDAPQSDDLTIVYVAAT